MAIPKTRMITSRRNGLKIAIPNTPQVGNLMQRFNIRGDNELVIEQTVKPTKDVHIGTTATTDEASSSEGAAASVDDVI